LMLVAGRKRMMIPLRAVCSQRVEESEVRYELSGV